jgi:hypothetical protein
MLIPSRRFLRVLVEGLIPDHASESPAERARALDFSAAFVQEQLQAMPLVLQVLLACGLAAFRAVTWARWLRGVGALGAAKRQAWMHAWAYGRVSLARRLFRPLRSLAALAYFESIG